MVLTPQLLQAIKLLQMPNLELTQFIENELASNPLLERAEEREEASSEPADRPRLRRSAGRTRRLGGTGAGDGRRPLSPPISAPRSTTPSMRTAARPASQSAPADDLSANAWTGVGAGARRRRGPRPRSLCRRGRVASRPSRASGRDPARRPGRAHDRRGADRRAGRGRIFRRLDWRNRRAARRRRRARRARARAHADPRADRRVRALARRVPGPSAQGARPLRSGDAGVHREPAGPRQARLSAAAPRLRRRRRGLCAT